MHFHFVFAVLYVWCDSVAGQTQYLSTKSADIEAARAAAKTLSPTSSVEGKTFNRFVQIFLENTDYELAATQTSLKELATRGITLTNYHGIVHPSMPNYIAAVGGTNHWVLWDYFWRIGRKQRTIVDLLDAKSISWSEYQEELPYSGFQGDFVNQQDGSNNYVRKHNPLILFDSVSSSVDRLAKIKNFTMFKQDLANNQLPQWMFITPNMTNDGHDTDIEVAGDWAKSFLDPLLEDENFLAKTLVLLTFDESGNYFNDNRVFSVLLGDAVPEELHGTSNDEKFSHYSIMATVERNWDLGNLGLGDKGAKPFF